MRTLAIANEKGGSARTTTTVCVAGVLAERGERVLLIDLDPQAAATRWLGLAPTDGAGLSDVFTGRQQLAPLVVATDVEGVHLVPADEWLAAADASLPRGAELRLGQAARNLDGWDWVLIDTPPNLGVLTIAATLAADYAVVPCGAASIDLAGVVRITRRVAELAELYEDAATIGAYVPCRVKTTTSLSGEVLAELQDHFGDRVTPPVRDTVRLVEAPSYGLPITHYAPTHPAADDYRAVTDAIVRLTGGPQQ